MAQEGVVDSKTDSVELDVAAGPPPRELSYPMAQAIALLITAGVLVIITLLITLLTTLT